MFSELGRPRGGMKGQIFPVLIVIVAILIIAALITVNLGKVSMDRLYCINAADAGAIAGVSAFTSGYNQAGYSDTVMFWTYLALQIYLFIPACDPCWWFRELWVLLAGYINDSMYDWAELVVDGYSHAARQDAYYYAFMNAGIDDKYKCIDDPACTEYRDKPLATETWEQWTNYKSAFSHWLNTLPDGWADADSLTYTWHDNSKAVTITYNGSSPEHLEANDTILWGFYLCIYSGIPCSVPCILPHTGIKYELDDPSRRWARMTVERRNYGDAEQGDLGFWTTMHPATQAAAEVEMDGHFDGWLTPFDLDLEE